MLIIARTGSPKHLPNSITGLRTALRSPCDTVLINIRHTNDDKLVLAQQQYFDKDPNLRQIIRKLSLKELQKRTASSERQVISFDRALKESFGHTLLMINIAERRAVAPMFNHLAPYIQTKADWDNVIFTSFQPLTLRTIRRQSPEASLGLLLRHNDLAFTPWVRSLRLEAVGFHRLHASSLAVATARQAGLFPFAYTVNRPQALNQLSAKGIAGIVTDTPELFS